MRRDPGEDDRDGAGRVDRDGVGRDDRDGVGRTSRGGFEYRREGPSGKMVALGVLVLLIGIFVLQNFDRANVNFLFWDVTVRVWVVILLSVALGFAAGWIVARVGRRRRDKTEDRGR